MTDEIAVAVTAIALLVLIGLIISGIVLYERRLADAERACRSERELRYAYETHLFVVTTLAAAEIRNVEADLDTVWRRVEQGKAVDMLREQVALRLDSARRVIKASEKLPSRELRA